MKTIMRNEVYDIQRPSPDTVRVLYLDFDKKPPEVVVISLLRNDSLPYSISYSELLIDLATGEAKNNDGFPVSFVAQPSVKQQEAADSAWELIGTFVEDEPDCFDNKIRSRFISNKSKETGVTRARIQRLLYRYWAGGSTRFALYPLFTSRGGGSHSGGRPRTHSSPVKRVIIGDKEKAYIAEAMKKYYNKENGYSFQKAYEKMLQAYYTDPTTNILLDERITRNQFMYYARDFLDPKLRAGSKKYDKDMRGLTGSSRAEAQGPGDLYQIDATLADVYLVSQYNRQDIVGRPLLYIVIDVFSRAIVGFYVCLEYASWDNARLALLNAFEPKVDFCKQYEVDISEEQWPCSGLPRALAVDNGELISRASNAIIQNLGITVRNEPAYRPDLKGIVESQFRLLNINVKNALPGAVHRDFNERGGNDYRLDAVLTLKEFTKIIILHILKHNQTTMTEHPQLSDDVLRDHVPPIPNELWNWGIANRSGGLRKMSPEDLDIALSERGAALVTPRGIKFKDLYYECDTSNREEWFSRARTNKTWKIPIAFKPNNLDSIVYLKDNNTYERCYKISDSRDKYSGLSIEEIDWLNWSRKSQLSSLETHDLQQRIDFNSEIDQIVNKAKEESKIVSIQDRKHSLRQKRIKENRKKEAELLREEEKDEATTKNSKETGEVEGVNSALEMDVDRQDEYHGVFDSFSLRDENNWEDD